MQVVLSGSLRKADMYAMLYFNALSQRGPNKQRHNQHHNMQQFEIREITTLKPYFDLIFTEH